MVINCKKYSFETAFSTSASSLEAIELCVGNLVRVFLTMYLLTNNNYDYIFIPINDTGLLQKERGFCVSFLQNRFQKTIFQ